MLKDIEFNKPEDKDSLKKQIKALRARLLGQQQALLEAKLPVIVLIEGWAAAGKGSLIKELISEIDPRFYSVVSPVIVPESEERYPFLYQYVKAIPQNGKLTFLDSGWMESAVQKFLRHEITKDEFRRRVRQVNEFERQLRDGGYIVLKIFLHIEKNEQFKRLQGLAEAPETEWRVTGDDLWQHREYKRFRDAYDDFMDRTGATVGWHILDGSNRKAAVRDAMSLLVQTIDQGLKNGRYVGDPFEEEFPLIKMPKLAEVDLSPAIGDEEYRKELKKLQNRLSVLHNILYRKKIPVILCYEGWDAA
ncbi:MAG: phosphate--AMP phosphotransferase, partial [Clostridia bacterium]|nr:phosphate--AMP phosphotransferase [Clostridia bacterium]